MAAPNPPVVADHVPPIESAPQAAPGSRSAAATPTSTQLAGFPAAQYGVVQATGNRKRMGMHVVGDVAPDVRALPAEAEGASKARRNVAGVKKKAPAPTKKTVGKNPAKRASLLTLT